MVVVAFHGDRQLLLNSLTARIIGLWYCRLWQTNISSPGLTGSSKG